jgi:hypothetical protein
MPLSQRDLLRQHTRHLCITEPRTLVSRCDVMYINISVAGQVAQSIWHTAA